MFFQILRQLRVQDTRNLKIYYIIYFYLFMWLSIVV